MKSGHLLWDGGSSNLCDMDWYSYKTTPNTTPTSYIRTTYNLILSINRHLSPLYVGIMLIDKDALNETLNTYMVSNTHMFSKINK